MKIATCGMIASLGLVLSAGPGFTAADPVVLKQLTDAANNGCLSGNEYKLTATVDGKLNFIKTGSASASTTVDVIHQNGAGVILNDNLKYYMNQATINCLNPFTNSIIAYILREADRPAPTQVIAQRIFGPSVTSHAGNNPSDGPDVSSCATADVANGWHLRRNSGSPDTVSVGNGDMAVTASSENADTYCITFHMRRLDKGKSASAVGRASATQEKTVAVNQ